MAARVALPRGWPSRPTGAHWCVTGTFGRYSWSRLCPRREAAAPAAAPGHSIPALAPRLRQAGIDTWVRDLPKASDHAPTWVAPSHRSPSACALVGAALSRELAAAVHIAGSGRG